ncbi:MAG: ABC transporter ATP-binding protein [Thermomicrobium sp.]|nr:ABC transporter ATP-binding protein [Thermomicrobium sp.]MDW8005985.1 ABC transporter ATP-binding protein [Thermomicrobium sp.]
MSAGLVVERLTFVTPERRLLDGVDLVVSPGTAAAIMGPSGSGKTTFLQCLCGIRRPTSGRVVIDGTEIWRLREDRRAAFRLARVGLVFQFGELLPELSAVENVMLPLRFLGWERSRAEQRAHQLLEELGLAHRATAHPEQLSGGEIQRVGIARALATAPALVLADEPTGMLDEMTARVVAQLLVSIARQQGAIVIIATHDPIVAGTCDVTYRLRDGRLWPIAPEERQEISQCS